MKKRILLSQIGLYNPQRISDSDVENLFVVRTKLFSFLIDKLKKEKTDSIPQHYLIIAQRGMGKTTMLKRIEVELRKSDFNQLFIPLLFPEEQYNMKNLAEFWLNSLDALADTLEVEKQHEEAVKIDIKVKELEKVNNNEELANEAYKFLKSICYSLNRRPVLLIDNMNLIFDRLEKAEQHTLRAWLMQNGAPILIGASAVAIEGTTDYGAPFYDAFQIHYLKRLSFEELKEVLTNLAKLTQSDDVIPLIEKETGRIKTLHQLTGGNPRTAVMLFRLIIKGFSKEINDDLEALLDEITPLYKARFEELSTQMQVIVDAIALHWDPINLEQLREASHYENNQLSPQLKRLVELGWIEKLDAYKAKGGAYQISERFFNIWFLMRRSSRRQKKELYCLSKFLESFYGEDIQQIAEARLLSKATCVDHVTYSLALAEVVNNGDLSSKLREKSFNELREFAKVDPHILTQFNIPTAFINEELVKKLEEVEVENESQNYLRVNDLLNELDYLTDSDISLNIFILRLKGINYVLLNDNVKAEINLQKAIKLNNKDAESWFTLAFFYQRSLHKYTEAEEAYLKAILIDEKNAKYWFELGTNYRLNLNNSLEAENAFLKAISIDKKNAKYWFALGVNYHLNLNNPLEAEKSYLKAISFDKKNVIYLILLGHLYENLFNNYLEAEKTYIRAIELNKKDTNVWNTLGNLYQDDLQEYDKAESSYRTAISLNKNGISPKINLIFLLRDKMNRVDEAKELFSTLKISDDFEDSYWLNKALFDLYKKNEGLAKESFTKALDKIESTLPESTQDDWWRFGAVVAKLGYGRWLLAILEEKGYDIILSPYYVAIKAMTEKDADAYLNSKAVEIREPAIKLMEIMQKY